MGTCAARPLSLPTACTAILCTLAHASATGDGGWLQDVRPSELLRDGRCDILRATAGTADIDAALFDRDVRHRLPLLVANFEAAGLWPRNAREGWNRDALRRLLSCDGSANTATQNVYINHASGVNFAEGGGEPAAPGAARRFCELLDIMREQTLSFDVALQPQDDNVTFDNVVLGQHPELLRDWGDAERFLGFRSSGDHERHLTMTPEGVLRGPLSPTIPIRSILSLGASRRGLPWHEHGETWFALLYGEKRWWLAPPGVMFKPPRESRDSAWTWFVAANSTSVASHDDSGSDDDEYAPKECVQHAGEVLYLPERWQHLTINVGEAVGIGLQADG